MRRIVERQSRDHRKAAVLEPHRRPDAEVWRSEAERNSTAKDGRITFACDARVRQLRRCNAIAYLETDESSSHRRAAERNERAPADEIAVIEIDQPLETQFDRILATGYFPVEQNVTRFDAKGIGRRKAAFDRTQFGERTSKRICVGSLH